MMQPKESKQKLMTNPNYRLGVNTPNVVTRRNFIRRITTALSAIAIGVAGLITRSAKAAAPVWAPIPNQIWRLGEPVFLDLSDFVTDADGDALSFSLDSVLPPGITISGSVISGVPTSEFSTTEFTATADDGTSDIAPNPPTGLTIS